MNSLQSTSILLIAGGLLLTLATFFKDEMLAEAAARVNVLATAMAGENIPDFGDAANENEIPERVFIPGEEDEEIVPPPNLQDDSNNQRVGRQPDSEPDQESNEQTDSKNQNSSIQDKQPQVVETPVLPPLTDVEADPDTEQSPFEAGPARPSEDDSPDENNNENPDRSEKPTGENSVERNEPRERSRDIDFVEAEPTIGRDPTGDADPLENDDLDEVGDVDPTLSDTGIPPGFINVPGVGVVDSDTFLEALALASAAQSATGQNLAGQNLGGQNQNGRNQNGNQNGDNNAEDRSFLQPILIDPTASSPSQRQRPKADEIIEAVTAPQAGKRVKEIVDVIEGESRRRTVTYTDNSFEEIEVIQPKTGAGKRIQRVGTIAKQWIDSNQNQHTRRTYQEQSQELARAKFDSQSFEVTPMSVAPSTRMDELFQTANGFRGGRVAATTRRAPILDETEDDEEQTSPSPSIDSMYWTRINDKTREVTERGPGVGRSPDRLIVRDFIASIKSRIDSSVATKSKKRSTRKSRPKAKNGDDGTYLLDSSQFDNLGGFFSKD